MMTDLTSKKCVPCEGGVQKFTMDEAKKYLAEVEGWTLNEDGTALRRDFTCKDFYHTMAFVNAIAWIANHENHHPDLLIGYNYCTVQFYTHAIEGLSENDFICAAKVNALES